MDPLIVDCWTCDGKGEVQHDDEIEQCEYCFGTGIRDLDREKTQAKVNAIKWGLILCILAPTLGIIAFVSLLATNINFWAVVGSAGYLLAIYALWTKSRNIWDKYGEISMEYHLHEQKRQYVKIKPMNARLSEDGELVDDDNPFDLDDEQSKYLMKGRK